MEHRWGAVLGELLAARGLSAGDLSRRLRERHPTLAPDAVDDWLVGLYVPGTNVWSLVNELLELDDGERRRLLEAVAGAVPGEPLALASVCDAARRNDVSGMAEALRHGVLIDRCDASGRIAICEAVRSGAVAAARFLLERGANANAMEIGGTWPITLADEIGSADLIRLLLDRGAYAHTDPKTGRSGLHLLARLDRDAADIARAERVLEQGVGVDARYADGPTPLFDALRSGNWPMARFLLDHGAQISRRDARRHRDLLRAAAAADTALARQIDAVDPSPKPPYPRWFNEARARGIERIEYVCGRGFTFAIDLTEIDEPWLIGTGESGDGAAVAATELLARPGYLASLEACGLGWLIAYVRKMAAGERFGVNELLRGNAVVRRVGTAPALS